MMKAKAFLEELNKAFLPIRIRVPGGDGLSVEAHLSELLDAFEAIDKKANGDHPIAAIAPIFYKFHDWVNDDASQKRAGDITWHSRIPTMKDRVIAQGNWAHDRETRRTTEENVRASNKSEHIQRLIILLRDESHMLDMTLLLTSVGAEGDDVIACSIPEEVRKAYCELGITKVPVALEPAPIGTNPRSRPDIATQVDYDKAKATGKEAAQNRPHTAHEITTAVKGNNETADRELRDLAASMTSWLQDHSVFIDEKHCLLYIFSNTVQVGNRQKGCGGLFLLLENEALDSIDWLHQAKRVSDKIANRIIHQMQLGEIEAHALNSAITQTAARNYAHHIGAHVKMRTTPQEIKKRIAELYGEVDWRKADDAKPATP